MYTLRYGKWVVMSAVTFSMTYTTHDSRFRQTTHTEKKNKSHPSYVDTHTHMAHKDKGAHTNKHILQERHMLYSCDVYARTHTHRAISFLPSSESDWDCLTYILQDMYTGGEEMKSLSFSPLLSLSLFHILCSFQCLFIASWTHTHTHGSEEAVMISWPECPHAADETGIVTV